jgi:hypothetical protein
MWKPAGVVCLWLALIATPHVNKSSVQVSAPGAQLVQLATAVPSDDPGDPYQTAARAHREAPTPRSFATVHFKNKLDKQLTLVSATLALDGTPLAPVTDFGPLGDNVVFKAYVTPGPHVVTTHLMCLGGKRGPFTYLADYKWRVDSEQTLNLLPNRSMVFTISAVRRKGINVPLDKQVEVSVYNELLPEPVSSRE